MTTTSSFFFLQEDKKNDQEQQQEGDLEQQEETIGTSTPDCPVNKSIHGVMLLLDAKDWGAILEEVQYIPPQELLEEYPRIIQKIYNDDDDPHDHDSFQTDDYCYKTGEGGNHQIIFDSSSSAVRTRSTGSNSTTGAGRGRGSPRANFLHQACALPGVPTYVIQAICQVNPRVLYSIEVTYQRTALHIACLKGIDFNIVATLLQIDETNRRHHDVDDCHHHHDSNNNKTTTMMIAEIPDVYGRLPIHYAAMDRSRNGEKNLRLLLKAAPRSLMVQDIDGYTPLHIACKMGLSMSMIRLFLLTAPDSIVLRTNKKEDAAHFARLCSIPGIWTAKQQVEIVDYLQNLALVTNISIARNGFCRCSYLSKEGNMMIHHSLTLRRPAFSNDNGDGNQRDPKAAPSNEECRPTMISSPWATEENESSCFSNMYSGETCSDEVTADTTSTSTSEGTSMDLEDNEGGGPTSFDYACFQHYHNPSPCHVGPSAA